MIRLNTSSPHRSVQRQAAARAALLLGCAFGSAPVCAAAAAAFAAPAAVAAPAAGTGVLRVVVALVVVLALVLAAAWLARRVRGIGGGGGAGLTVLAQLQLGARERAVLLRVGQRQLLIGVAAGNVRTLYVLDESLPTARNDAAAVADPQDASQDKPTFKSLLLRSLGK
jgi:flagellar protein FliO/FliZ